MGQIVFAELEMETCVGLDSYELKRIDSDYFEES